MRIPIVALVLLTMNSSSLADGPEDELTLTGMLKEFQFVQYHTYAEAGGFNVTKVTEAAWEKHMANAESDKKLRAKLDEQMAKLRESSKEAKRIGNVEGAEAINTEFRTATSARSMAAARARSRVGLAQVVSVSRDLLLLRSTNGGRIAIPLHHITCVVVPPDPKPKEDKSDAD